MSIFVRKLPLALLIVFIVVFAAGSALYSQQQGSMLMLAPRLLSGVNLYTEGRWRESIAELRRAENEAADAGIRGEARFWIAMNELMAGDYGAALHDIDEFLRIDPNSARAVDAPYHKARALYYLNRYNEAIPLFRQYVDNIRTDGRYANGVRRSDSYGYGYATAIDAQDDYNRKASGIYWIGESLYSLEQFDEAEGFFNTVVTQYNKSHKYEVSVNRVAMIQEKRLNAGLLDLVRLNQGGQAGSAASDSAYRTYQQQLGSMMQGSSSYAEWSRSQGYASSAAAGGGVPLSADRQGSAGIIGQGRLITTPSEYVPAPTTKTLDEAEMEMGSSARVILSQGGVGGANSTTNYEANTLQRLLNMKITALEMMDRLMSFSNDYDLLIDGNRGIYMPLNGRSGQGGVYTEDGQGGARILP